MGAGLMSRKDQFNSSELLDWLSIGIVASAAIVGYMVLMLITPGSKIGGCRSAWYLLRCTLVFRLTAIIGPAEQAATILRLGRRRWLHFRLRRDWRRKALALQRIDKFALGRLADRCAGVDARCCALMGLGRRHQLRLRPSRRRR